MKAIYGVVLFVKLFHLNNMLYTAIHFLSRQYMERKGSHTSDRIGSHTSNKMVVSLVHYFETKCMLSDFEILINSMKCKLI